MSTFVLAFLALQKNSRLAMFVLRLLSFCSITLIFGCFDMLC